MIDSLPVEIVETVDEDDESDLQPKFMAEDAVHEDKSILSLPESEEMGKNEGWCDGCAFLHYFMLEELPRALQCVERMEKNAASLGNALEYHSDAHHKFMLYQAHLMRVVNQNRKLEEYEQTLYDLCFKEQNEMPLHLWAIIDF
jgi:hypothetical protein